MGGAKQVPVPTRNGVLWSLLTGTDTGRSGTRRQDKVVIGVPCDGKPRETALPEAKTLQAVACGLEAGQPEACFDGRKPGARRAVHSNGESTEGRGVSIVSMDPEHRTRLDRWLRKLSAQEESPIACT